ncbi:MAG TPA: ferritin-like protein, partial [Thermoanaerobaculia bacterium]
MIETLPDLRRHLTAAVQLELSVLPPYLCAYYSLVPGSNVEVGQIIRSVLVEEMLHMTLAANVLNAVGGRLQIDEPGFVPVYPAYLPDGEKAFQVHLLPFSEAAIETFLKVEEPSHPYAGPPVAERYAATALRVAELGPYRTVGEFYQAIVDGLEALVAKLGEREVFTGDPARQVPPELYYGGGGTVTAVRDLAAARRALDEIIDQGEGETRSMFDGDGDLAHFFRFLEIKHQRRYAPDQRHAIHGRHFEEPKGEPFPVDYTAVYPMLHDPRPDDYPAGELRDASTAFDRLYSHLLRQLQGAFDGRPDLLL